MSVQQEHLNAATTLAKGEGKSESVGAAPDHVKSDAPPKLEYANPGRESLAMLGAAIGGALLGVFLTLLILAIVNRGTIRFNAQGQIVAMQETIAAVDQNVGALSANLDTVVARLEGLQSQADVLPALRGEIGAVQSEIGAVQAEMGAAQATLQAQQAELGQLNASVAVLDVNRQKFDVFTAALSDALSTMGALDGSAAPAAEVAPAEVAPVEVAPVAAPPMAEAASPLQALVTTSPELTGDTIQVFYFADANLDGVKAAEEAAIVGVVVNLVDSAGAVVASAETAEEGRATFTGLAPGEYSLTTAEGDLIAAVAVSADATAGQLVTVAISE